MKHESHKDVTCPMCKEKHTRKKDAKKMDKVMAGMSEHRKGMEKEMKKGM